ncbi:MAG: hypothetical protein JWO69_487 [Thermoleophilia bacterium]|nr:hypothetical protein [Thermoleophilia bacterium]
MELTRPRPRTTIAALALAALLAAPAVSQAVQERIVNIGVPLETSSAPGTAPADVAAANALPYRQIQTVMPPVDTDGGVEAMELRAIDMPYYVIGNTPTATVPGALETDAGAALVNPNVAVIPAVAEEGISPWAWAVAGVGVASLIAAAVLVSRRRPERTVIAEQFRSR